MRRSVNIDNIKLMAIVEDSTCVYISLGSLVVFTIFESGGTWTVTDTGEQYQEYFDAKRFANIDQAIDAVVAALEYKK